jgi:beta-lactamase superfamily II metal-dependent hydrolase
MAPKMVLMALIPLVVSCLPALPDASSGGGQSESASAGRGSGECGSGSWNPGWLEIHHIDAGEAVSTLIVSPIGRTMLIDAGEARWDGDDGAKVVGAYVRSVLGCASLDYVVLSHFHLDHVGYPGHGGLWHLVHEQGFVVGRLLHRDLFRYAGAGGDSLQAWRAYLQSDDARALNPEVAVLGAGQVQLGGGVAFAFVAVDSNGDLPAGDFAADSAPPDENDYSIAALLRMGRLDYFTAGDMSGEMLISAQGGYSYHDIETRTAAQVKDVDVYRVSHHGSSHASNATLLAEMQPRVSIVQVADGNGNGHPTQSAVDRLLGTSALYLTERGDPSTDLRTGKVVGHVVLRTSTGIEYSVNGDWFVASDPPRVDRDQDGYFSEADPDDGSAGEVPGQNGGCDAWYETCPSPG